MHDLAQLRVLHTGWRSSHNQNQFHIGSEQAFAQDPLPHHPRRAENNYLHACDPN